MKAWLGCGVGSADAAATALSEMRERETEVVSPAPRLLRAAVALRGLWSIHFRGARFCLL